MKRTTSLLVSAALSVGLTAGASAATQTYSDQVAFQAALDDGSTVIDTSAYIGLTTAQLSELFDEAEFFGPESFVRNDGLIPNGSGFFGADNPHVGLNFAAGVFGVGVTSNAFDGGTIFIYDGLDGTGNLLGSAAFGQNAPSLFGGIISTDLIRSAVFTCEYNFDLACGLIDPVYGRTSPVPLPAAVWLFGSGLLGLLTVGRRRSPR